MRQTQSSGPCNFFPNHLGNKHQKEKNNPRSGKLDVGPIIVDGGNLIDHFHYEVKEIVSARESDRRFSPILNEKISQYCFLKRKGVCT